MTEREDLEVVVAAGAADLERVAGGVEPPRRRAARRARSTRTQPDPEQSARPSSTRSARASQPFESDARPETRYWCEIQTPSRAARSQSPGGR